MNSTLFLTPGTRSTAGVLLLTIVAIQYGCWFMLGRVGAPSGKARRDSHRFGL